eukprot:7330774-Heterocapsa_arctica.AAC.1
MQGAVYASIGAERARAGKREQKINAEPGNLRTPQSRAIGLTAKRREGVRFKGPRRSHKIPEAANMTGNGKEEAGQDGQPTGRTPQLK